MRRLGWAIDWDRVLAAHEPEYYRWTQWLFLKFFEEGPRLPQGGAGQLVPGRPDRARERAGDQRPLRALRRRRRDSQDWSSGSSGSPPTRTQLLDGSRAARLAGADEDDPAQLDRPLRGRRDPLPDRRAGRRRAGLHDAARHAVRRDLLRARARSIRSWTRWRALAPRGRAARVRAARARPSASRSARPTRRRPASSPATTPRTRQRRADAGLGRRLRADGLRHRRDHGRACPRRARPRVRRDASACRSARSIDEDGRARQLGRVRGLPAEEAKQAIVEWLGERGRGAAGGQLPAARLGLLAPALLGLPDPDRLLRRAAGSCPCPTTSCRCCCRRSRTTGRRASRRWPPTRSGCTCPCPRCGGPGAARGRHDGHLRRLVLVLPALRRPAATTRRRSTARSSTTGARSTSTSAGSTTRPGTCCTRASSSR